MSDKVATIKDLIHLEDEIGNRLTLAKRSDQPDTLALILDDDDPQGRTVAFFLTALQASQLVRALTQHKWPRP